MCAWEFPELAGKDGRFLRLHRQWAVVKQQKLVFVIPGGSWKNTQRDEITGTG